jgi:hypothetical protein
MSRLDQFAGDEAGDKPVSFSIGRIVIHKNIIGVLPSFPKAFHGFTVRFRNRCEGHRLPSVTIRIRMRPTFRSGSSVETKITFVL